MTTFSTPRTGKSGTREWAEHSVNIGFGCSNGCLYCYARYNAVARFKHISDPAEWRKERITHLPRFPKKHEGVVMFPTTHDITPFYLEGAVLTLSRLLDAGNQVLIVTKPRLEIIKRLCAELVEYKEQVLFRFTITTMNAATAAYWEPGAPSPTERLEALIHAHMQGYQTSVSAEPLLGGAATGIELFNTVAPFVSDKVWLGKLNNGDSRIFELDVLPDCRRRATAIDKAQRDHVMLDLYNALKNQPKVAWKESIQRVIDRHVA